MTAIRRSVPFFNYPDLFNKEEPELVALFKEVCGRGAFIMQRDLATFEAALAEYTGARYALGVGNATDGLILACKAAGIGPGDEVILSSHTMLATAIAVHEAGGTPVPVDCGEDHLIDAKAVEGAITPRTKALFPTHLNGRVADMDALGRIASRHGLLLLEDAAQALGARFKGRAAGTFGIASAISFYPAKVLGCLGDGGVILTSDDAINEKLWQLRDFGRNRNGDVVSWGVNTRLDNLQAAFLNFRLAGYGAIIERRRELAARYHQHLRGITRLKLPPAPASDPDRFDIYQNYEIETDRRDELKAYLAGSGVGTLVQWNGVAIHQCRALGFTQDLPYTDQVMKRMLLLPLNMSIKDEEVDYVCEKIHSFHRE